MASDSEIEDDISTPVVKAKGVLKKKGLTFVIGSWPGFTKSKIERIITEDAGGKSTKDYTDIECVPFSVSDCDGDLNDANTRRDRIV